MFCNPFMRGCRRVAQGAFMLYLLVCWTATAVSPPTAGRLTVHDGALRDASGRQVFLWGVNLGEKNPDKGYMGWHDPEAFNNLRRWGMNAIRLLIFWDGVEPEPGRYNEQYLSQVDERIRWAENAGLHVVLDMHQDLWGVDIPGGNGAPAWATLDDALEHRTIGGAWSTAYFSSPRIHRAFDNFWNNTPGPDGVGIQDRFALAWQHVAQRYADVPTVVGFDLLNEPFPGSAIRSTAIDLWRALPRILRNASMPTTFRELIDSYSEQPMPRWLLDTLDDSHAYRWALLAIAPSMGRFETEHLMPMYLRVHRAIREVHKDGIFFLEPSVLANVGTATSIFPLPFDPLQAYMPHAYDIVVDTPLAHQPSKNRLTIIIEGKKRDAQALGLPLLIGEWGAYYGNPRTRNAARMASRLIDEHTSGAFYWDYHTNIDKAAYFEVLAKPAPLYLAGDLEYSRFDPESGVFECRWNSAPESTAPSWFAAPPAWSPLPPDVQIFPETVPAHYATHPDDAQVGYVVVETPASETRLLLRITPRGTAPYEKRP